MRLGEDTLRFLDVSGDLTSEGFDGLEHPLVADPSDEAYPQSPAVEGAPVVIEEVDFDELAAVPEAGTDPEAGHTIVRIRFPRRDVDCKDPAEGETASTRCDVGGGIAQTTGEPETVHHPSLEHVGVTEEAFGLDESSVCEGATNTAATDALSTVFVGGDWEQFEAVSLSRTTEEIDVATSRVTEAEIFSHGDEPNAETPYQDLCDEVLGTRRRQSCIEAQDDRAFHAKRLQVGNLLRKTHEAGRRRRRLKVLAGEWLEGQDGGFEPLSDCDLVQAAQDRDMAAVNAVEGPDGEGERTVASNGEITRDDHEAVTTGSSSRSRRSRT